MITYPNYTEFHAMAQKGDLVPIVKEIILDCETPVSIFRTVLQKEKSAFLLESVEYGEKIGRFSFISFAPDMIIERKNNKTFIYQGRTQKKREKKEHILDVLRSIIQKEKLVESRAVPYFSGGLVGYFGYENVSLFEDITLKKLPRVGFPDAIFFRVRQLIIFDHLDKKVRLLVLCQTRGDKEKNYRAALSRIAQLERLVRQQVKKANTRKKKKKPRIKIKSNMTRAVYERKVKRIKEYIRAGDVIQVVFSQRFSLGQIDDDFKVYRALRTINPSPYMFYFKHGKMRLIGSSPELLVKKEKKCVEVRPIAGTRKRGETLEEDTALEQELCADKKELAEHLMLVDLGRNDLGRVCSYRSIKVSEYAHVEKFSHVMHLVSNVRGTIKDTHDAFDLLRVTFPAGTLSGAPKIRAMEIINELEPDERGPYGGCLGYFSYAGNCDMCITIRTIMIQGKNAYLQAGGGIVYDSDPVMEYHETVNKAKALVKAVELAHDEL